MRHGNRWKRHAALWGVLGGIASLCGTGKYAAAQGLFPGEQKYKEAVAPYYAAVADINKDGKPDIVSTHFGDANSSFGVVSVRVGSGDGTFQGAQRYKVGSGSLGIAVGDLDGDGWPDIATADYSNNTVSVLRSNGAGRFLPVVTYPVGPTAYGIKLGDFNGDGHPDIAVVCEYEDTLSVLMNNGDGTFAPRVIYPVGAHVSELAVADLNGDGKDDIVVTNFRGASIGVLLNNGAGAFAPMVAYATSLNATPYGIVLADVNGDGELDAIVSTYAAGTIEFFHGNGDGTFQPYMEIDGGALPSQLAFEDMDGDGSRDIVVTNDQNNYFTVLYGKDDFLIPDTYVVGDWAYGAAIADLDGDGKPDAVIANRQSSDLSVMLQADLRASVVTGTVTLEALDYFAARPVTFTFRPDDGTAPFDRITLVDSDGDFIFANIPANTYTLHIKSEIYLAANVTLDTTAGNVSAIMALLHGGDATNDNTVDIGDFGVLVNAYNGNANVPGSPYDYHADFNGDGIVDIGDFGLLVNNYNLSGDL